MARARMVTRTIEMTVAEVMCMDVSNASVTINTYTVAGKHVGDKLLEILKKEYETDTLKLVHVSTSTVNEVLYGMLESDFIRMAKELPPRSADTTTDSE